MKITKYIVSVFLCLTLLSGMIVFFVLDKKEFSENENRVLSKLPKFSYEALESGKYLLSLEEYMKDHLPARDVLMKLKTKAQKGAGFKIINDVYLADSRLISHIENPDTEIFVNSVNTLFSNINEDIRTTVMLIPTAGEIYKDTLPSYSHTIDEKEIINNILSQINCDIKPDLINSFEAAKETGNIFYTSDHHWTSYGASVAYLTFLESVGNDSSAVSFDITNVTDSFKGTLYSKVPDDSFCDTIEKYTVSGTSFKCIMGDSVDSLSEAPYYAEEYLSKKDKYAYFGNENQPLIILENADCVTDDEIVLVKDSFANCLAPLLSANYKRVHIIDTRYMRKPKVSEYVSTLENVTDVMILYGLDSLNNNTGISRIS